VKHLRRVAVMFAAAPSVYDGFAGVDVWNKTRDARRFPGGMPVVAHPPCAQWGRLKAFANDDPAEKLLALFAVEQIRTWGGVLEHPFPSSLWTEANLPRPGVRDRIGGFTFPVHQTWFGHRARKPTLLYIVGVEPFALPSLPYSMAEPSVVISTSTKKGERLPALSGAHRAATPPEMAKWLIAVARAVRIPTQTAQQQVARAQFEDQVVEVAA